MPRPLVVLAALSGLAASLCSPAAPAAADTGPPTVLTAVTPCRLLDTRDGGGAPVAAGATVRVVVAGRCGVPTGATAAVLTLTAVDTAGAGFLSLAPAAAGITGSSVLNVVAGDTRAATALVPLAADGSVTAYTQPRAHLVVDVGAAFTPAPGAAAAGRFVPRSPVRVLDTRSGPGPRGPLAPGALVQLPLAPVPAGASAVALTLTATDALASGYLTAWPDGAPRPLSSVLNLRPGQIRANLAVVALPPSRVVDLFTTAGGALVADVVGWFTGDAAPASTDGRFVPLPAPVRLLDTRNPASRLAAGQVLDLAAGGREGIAGDAAAIAGTVTAVDTGGPTWAAAWPAGSAWPGTSSVNSDASAPVAASGVAVGLGAGRLDLVASRAADLVVDAGGWFTGGTPAEAGQPAVRIGVAPPPNLPTGTGATELPVDVTGVGAAAQVVSVAASGTWSDVGFWSRGADGRFSLVRSTRGRIGRSGVSTDHHEGDGSTPAGVFSLSVAFGSETAPSGTSLPYRRLDALDWWVSDTASPLYNTWQRCAAGTCSFDEAAGEHLLSVGGGGGYRLAVAFDQNTAPVVAGRGSAMFLHVIGPDPTSGCVAIPYADMAWALTWLRPGAVILIGGPGVRPA